jgi:hypothetical protein
MADVVGIIALIISLLVLVAVIVALYFGITGYNKVKTVKTGELNSDSIIDIEGVIIVNGKATIGSNGTFSGTIPANVFKDPPIIQITPVDPATPATTTPPTPAIANPFYVSNVSATAFTVNGLANTPFFWTVTGKSS